MHTFVDVLPSIFIQGILMQRVNAHGLNMLLNIYWIDYILDTIENVFLCYLKVSNAISKTDTLLYTLFEILNWCIKFLLRHCSSEEIYVWYQMPLHVLKKKEQTKQVFENILFILIINFTLKNLVVHHSI